MNNLNPNSHLTAIERTSLSYPARLLINKNKMKGKILDFGCGIGKDVELLNSKGYDIKGYDPHYFPNYPSEKFDTILCFYVLNVLLPEEQAEVLMNVSNLLKPNGKAYFAVRRDIQYEGFRVHKVHKKETYQYILEGEDKLKYYEAMREQANYKIRKDYYSSQEKIVHTDFFFKEGCLYVFSQHAWKDYAHSAY